MFVSCERLVKFSEAMEQNLDELGVEQCFALLLNEDFRKFGEGGVPELKGDRAEFKGPSIVQVIKIANITEPSYSQHTQGGRGRVLMLTLTDGKRDCVGVEYGAVSGLGLDTPPGTKLRISNATAMSGVLLLHSNCCAVVGGVVPAMKEEWEVQRRYSNVARRIMIKEHRTGGNEEENEPPPKFSVFTKGTGTAARQQQQQQQKQQILQEMKEEKEEDDINSEYRKEVSVKQKATKHGREKTQHENKNDAVIHQIKTVQGRENQEHQQQQPQHQQPPAARRGRGESLAATHHV